MKSDILLFLSILTILASCNGQTTSQPTDKSVTLVVGDTVQELGNNIMVVYQDKKNNYWFGSWENGLYHYDPSVSFKTGSKTILHFTTQNGLPHNRIDDIKEDKSGNIYFNTPKGISKFDGQNFTTLPLADSDSQWKLEHNDLWFKSARYDSVLYRYNGKFLYELTLPKHPTYSNSYEVYSVYEDSKGNIWFGTNPLGAFRYDGKSFDWISEEDVTELHDRGANGVRSIIEDRDGYFWFNSAYRYDVYGKSNTQKSSFYKREKSIGNLDGSPDSDFWEYMSIAKDNNGELWIATYGNGVWRYDGTRTTYYPVHADTFAKASASGGSEDITVFSIYKDNNGVLWLGTHENGAYKFNGNTFERFKP
jgi:ligand-binding sensor domain-containing protein